MVPFSGLSKSRGRTGPFKHEILNIELPFDFFSFFVYRVLLDTQNLDPSLPEPKETNNKYLLTI